MVDKLDLKVESDIPKIKIDDKVLEMLRGFVTFRHNINQMNATIKPKWLRSQPHYMMSMTVSNARLNRNQAATRDELVAPLVGKISRTKMNTVINELVDDGYLKVHKGKADARRLDYWATDRLLKDIFRYLVLSWECSYHNPIEFGYVIDLADNYKYLFETEEGQNIRSLYSTIMD